jgi:hypothetical protein
MTSLTAPERRTPIMEIAGLDSVMAIEHPHLFPEYYPDDSSGGNSEDELNDDDLSQQTAR